MNIVPQYISEDIESSAEARVFRAFQKVDIHSKSFLFHSVNLPDHQYKQWGEIDFLLISTSGIMVFEVKGGGISRENGIWTGTNRYGKQHVKSENPNDQAKSAMYALKKKLSKEFPTIDFAQIPFGWALIFPDIDYASKSLELPFEMVCDIDSIKRGNFQVFIENVYKYFKMKMKHPKELLPKEIQDISDYIRPDIDLVPKLKTSIRDSKSFLVRATNEQYSVLNQALENDRILCTGGGGTGKTLLAIEIAKRNPNKKILITCKSKILAKFIKGQISSEMVDVLSIYENQEFLNYYQKSIANEDLSSLAIEPKYDMLIVDEGQDLLSYRILEYLNLILVNNLKNGCWRWFMDINNQAGVDNSFTLMDLNKRYLENDDSNTVVNSRDIESFKNYREDEELGHEMLLETHPSKFTLTHNCRNTKQIIKDTQLNTGADIGIAKIKGNGSYPIFAKTSSKEETILKLEAALHKWSNEVERLNDIVILSTVNYSLSSAAYLSKKWQDQIQILTFENVLNQDQNRILFSTISDFKGLDKPIVAIIDIGNTLTGVPNNMKLEDNYIKKSINSFLYTGMTRSNSVLWIAEDIEFGDFLQSQREINIEKMMTNKTNL
jgi:hypothetical protein